MLCNIIIIPAKILQTEIGYTFFVFNIIHKRIQRIAIVNTRLSIFWRITFNDMI